LAAILVIEDDDVLRRLLRRALERDGHVVHEAGEGAEGVALYRRTRCDVVITDLFMPGQDGIETIQQLREENDGVRIIAISGGASSGDMGPLADARLFGADIALPKPFPIASLSRAVGVLLESGEHHGSGTGRHG
jgi:CheY-like chemotaxis protein